MSLMEDLYRDEDDNGGDLERVIEQDREHDAPDSDGDHPQSEAEEEPARRVDPTQEKKVKIVLNPRLTLNPKRLTGPRGIHTIEDVFKDFKFQGKGHEKNDLDMVMKNLEYWAHRLYPKFKFDDCLEKIANLGKKKEVSNHIRKIRLDMLHDENEECRSDNENVEETTETNEVVFDEFDQLLSQQIALARSTPASIKHNVATPSTLNEELPPSDFDQIIQMEPPNPSNKTEISIDQRERMLMNRKLAEQKRLERIKLLEEKNELHENVVAMEKIDDAVNIENKIKSPLKADSD